MKQRKKIINLYRISENATIICLEDLGVVYKQIKNKAINMMKCSLNKILESLMKIKHNIISSLDE